MSDELGLGLDTIDDIENEILTIVRNNDNFDNLLAYDNRWPILYHLSPIRQNLINWYPFNKDSSLLEIAAECGAITRVFCEKIKDVTVLEASKKKSQINYERHKDYNNLKIIRNFNEIKNDAKFEYITLLGGLEKASSFIKTSNPCKDILITIKSYLKADGKFIIAVKNRFGMKYWAGAKEDHTGLEFDGITGCICNNMKTFGKVELVGLLNSAGFKNLEFYYPYPDHNMPMEIFSDEILPGASSMLSYSPNYDYERYVYFDEALAYKGIIENNMFDFFANSFLVVCD